MEGSVSVTTTDPKDSLAAPEQGGALALDLSSSVTGTGLAHHDWPDQKPGRPDVESCLITVLPHGDPIQAGANLMHPNKSGEHHDTHAGRQGRFRHRR